MATGCQSDISHKSYLLTKLTLISNLKEITHLIICSYCHWYCWLRQNKNSEVPLSSITLYIYYFCLDFCIEKLPLSFVKKVFHFHH
jgi:hypothetical protein